MVCQHRKTNLAKDQKMTEQLQQIVAEFKRCLTTMSHSRAGWDYDLPAAQRAQEDREEKAALARARAIWAENAEAQDALRDAFKEVSPLATMREIENTGDR